MAEKARRTRSANSAADQLALAEMRSKLLADIEKFKTKAAQFIRKDAMLAARDLLRTPQNNLGEEWDEGDHIPPDSEDFEPDLPEDDEGDANDNSGALPAFVHTQVPERKAIPLPSTFGAAFCRQQKLTTLLKSERRLRIGQMNDALHRVRVAVGYKSLLYRTSIRQATSYRNKLRGFDEVHLTDAEVRANARLYSVTREGMIKLHQPGHEADQAELNVHLAKYQVLRDSDLRANTALIEQAVRGVSQQHLPWIWTIDVVRDAGQDGWMTES